MARRLDHDRMVALAEDQSAKEIATILGCAEQTVWDVLGPRGVRPIHKPPERWQRLDSEDEARGTMPWLRPWADLV